MLDSKLVAFGSIMLSLLLGDPICSGSVKKFLVMVGFSLL